MKIDKKAAVAAVAVLSCSGLAACGSNSDSGSGGKQIGFSVPFLTDAFQVQLVKGLESEAKGDSAKLLPAVDAKGDAAKQNEDIATLISRGIDGLIVGAVDSKAIIPAVERANKADIPVVAMDLGADGGKIGMIVRADNVKMGEQACQELGKRLDGGGGTVLNLQGALTSQNGRDRDSGFLDCMKSNFSGAKIMSKPMEWSAEKCADQAKTVISTTKLSGIYMASDNLCVTAVMEALKSRGELHKAGEAGHVPLVGIDGPSHALQAVRDGYQDVSVSQPNDLYTKYAWYYINALIDGKKFEVGPTDHGSEIVKIGNSLADQLPATVVTSENVDDPKLWGNK